ncbi:DUF4190 domain-containing protein [Candidatus Woesearchaeota archaeon]|nr:DUF4190 domain-containing protein [Candidatus Woesearchaeota archaeon]
MVENKSNTLGITSLVLGIVSIVFCWVPIMGLVAGIIGIVLSVKQKKVFPNGIATGGLVTSIIGTVFSVLYNIFWILAITLLKSYAANIGTI